MTVLPLSHPPFQSFDERRLYAMSLEAYKRRKVNITRWAEVRDELAELNARRALYTTRVV